MNHSHHAALVELLPAVSLDSSRLGFVHRSDIVGRVLEGDGQE